MENARIGHLSPGTRLRWEIALALLLKVLLLSALWYFAFRGETRTPSMAEHFGVPPQAAATTLSTGGVP